MDLGFADSLRALAGWNQTMLDWRRFLDSEPHGCFVAEWNGTPAGTATTTVYGVSLAWIGMVLVHPEYRRRGIGRALLVQCMEYLQARGVTCIKLDATPLGKGVYAELGFQEEWALSRWEHPGLTWPSTRSDSRIRDLRDTDVGQIDSFDVSAFGISRAGLLRSLIKDSHCALAFESEPDDIAGYGLLRTGARALYLGLVAARSSDVAISLIEALLARSGSQKVFWDIPDGNSAMVAWAAKHGFTVQRQLTRMYFGENRALGDPRKQFALGGPELG
jgi:GNAT superfamily N-acetyltransferase